MAQLQLLAIFGTRVHGAKICCALSFEGRKQRVADVQHYCQADDFGRGLVKYLKGERLVIPQGKATDLPASTSFLLKLLNALMNWVANSVLVCDGM